MKKIVISTLILSLLAVCFPFNIYASNTYTVALDVTGNFKTIEEAYKNAVDGDVIIVKPGIYTEDSARGSLSLYKNGITIKSEVRGAAIIDNQKNPDSQKVVYMLGNRNIIDGLELKNGADHGIVVYGNDNKILNCNIHDCGFGTTPDRSGHGQDGIYTDPKTYGTIISGNYIHDIGRPVSSPNDRLDHGIYACGDNEIISNNIITNISGHGIQVAGYDMVENLKIYNNTIAYTGISAVVIWDGFGTHPTDTNIGIKGVEVKNNIFYNCGTRGEGPMDTSGVTFNGLLITNISLSNNLTFGSKVGLTASRKGYTAADNIVADPMFVNDKSDYRLKASSPAIDKGTTLTKTKTDLDGVSRPIGTGYDIGAYESPFLQLTHHCQHLRQHLN